MKYPIAIALLACSLIATAQNRLMVLHPGDSVGSILRLGEYDELGTFDYHIPKTPLAVSGAFPFDVNFHSLANTAVNDFQSDHLDGYGIDQQHQLWLDAPVRLLNQSDYEYTTSDDWSNALSKIRTTICANKVLQEIVYQWLMPSYQDAFAQMSVPEQNAFLDIFKGGLAYLDTFDLAKEKAAATGGDSKWDFLYSRGKLNAFIYRRVSRDELTKEECRSWLNRIIKDFESVMRKNPAAADNYVLSYDLGNDYFIGDLFDPNVYGGESKEAILRKKQSTYELLPVEFTAATFKRPGLLIGVPVDTSYSSLLFLYDSVSWKSTRSLARIYPDGYVPLGDKGNERLLFILGWSEIPDLKYGSQVMANCIMVDADSGFVVADTFLLPTIIETDDHGSTYTFPGLDIQHMVYCDPQNGLYGMLDEYGNIILPPKYKSIEATTDPLVYKLNGRKKAHVKP